MACFPTFPTLSYLKELQCGGNGQCINQTCVCSIGYTGDNDWYDLSNQSCMINIEHLDIVYWVLYGITIMTVLLLLYRIATMGELVIFKSKQKLSKAQLRLIEPQIIMLLMTSAPLLIFAYLSLGLFIKVKLHSSPPLAVLLITITWVWQVSSFLINRWFILTAVRTISSFDIDGVNNAHRIVRILLLISIVSASLSSGFIIILLTISSQNVPNLSVFQIMCARGYVAVNNLTALAHIIPLYFTRKLRIAVEKHLLLSQTNGHENSKLSKARDRIKKAENSFYSTFIYIPSILFIIFPEWLPYQIVTFFFLALPSSLASYPLFPKSTLKIEQEASTENSLRDTNSISLDSTNHNKNIAF